MGLFYLDSSAIVKLVAEEAESTELRAFLSGGDLVSCELALAEVPRALRRAAAADARLPLDRALVQAGEVLAAIALVPLHRAVLLAAGALDEPRLRTLDAIHLAALADTAPLEAFVSYDARQLEAARLAGVRSAAPGAPATASPTQAGP